MKPSGLVGTAQLLGSRARSLLVTAPKASVKTPGELNAVLEHWKSSFRTKLAENSAFPEPSKLDARTTPIIPSKPSPLDELKVETRTPVEDHIFNVLKGFDTHLVNAERKREKPARMSLLEAFERDVSLGLANLNSAFEILAAHKKASTNASVYSNQENWRVRLLRAVNKMGAKEIKEVTVNRKFVADFGRGVLPATLNYFINAVAAETTNLTWHERAIFLDRLVLRILYHKDNKVFAKRFLKAVFNWNPKIGHAHLGAPYIEDETGKHWFIFNRTAVVLAGRIKEAEEQREVMEQDELVLGWLRDFFNRKSSMEEKDVDWMTGKQMWWNLTSKFLAWMDREGGMQIQWQLATVDASGTDPSRQAT